MSLFSLEGRVALVTGAGRGIGRGIAEKFGANGAKVVYAARTRSQLDDAVAIIESGGSEALAVEIDVSDLESINAGVQTAIDQFGQIDVLVNNAAVYAPAEVDWSLDDWHASWARTLQINLQAPADLCRAAIQHFRSRSGGVIVNVTSRGAYRGELAHYRHYAATTGGLGGLTRTIARSFAKDGVLAYCVSPGWCAAEMAIQGAPPEVLEAAIGDMPLGELTPPEDVAEIITFLSSGRARHATGNTIDVTGGSYMR